MANFNESVKEAVCIEEEVFFGPITDKERKIKEHFENVCKSEHKMIVESQILAENDISRNDSLYKSFSIDDSKYDSFDDSLDEENHKKPLGMKHVHLRKSFDKLKHKRNSFYDSLEDVCSLVSNIEKCSISCEVENDSNMNDKHHIIEDSLKNPLIVVANKSHGINEQVHFDDDSLAIAEFENAFDDSLEEFNVLSSIEIEEINDAEIVVAGNQNACDQNFVCASRNLFETSVEIICEQRREIDAADQESSGDKNLLYDSLSNSDFKDILKDSLENSEKCIDNMLKHAPDASIVTTKRSEQFNLLPSIKIEEITDSEIVTAGNQSIASEIDQSHICTPRKLFDTSVQIICEKKVNAVTHHIEDQGDLSDNKNMHDSLSNSDFKGILKDSLEESEKCFNNLKFVTYDSSVDTKKHEQASINPDNLDTSIQIVYEKLQNFSYNENNSGNFKCNISKDNLKNFINISNDPIEQTVIKPAYKDISHSQSSIDKQSTNNNEDALPLDSNVNQNSNRKEGLTTVVCEPVFPFSAVSNSNVNKETVSVDSCHLKLLNDNLNDDEDFKFQLHIEVTVGDKKCKIEAQDIKLLPVTGLNSKLCEKESSRMVHDQSENCINKEEIPMLVDSCSSKMSKEHNINENILSKTDSNEYNSCDKFKTESIANITHRVKASVSQRLSDSDMKFNCHENMSNDDLLLQALDLHDISASFLNESIIQSKDAVIPLNLCAKREKLHTSMSRNRSKENLPETFHFEEKKSCSSSKEANYSKGEFNETPKSLHKSPSFKEPTKKTPGTKIPVRKIENFAVPVASSNKFGKIVPTAVSAEKVKMHTHSHSAEVGKKTIAITPNKTPHFCKVRNTIFSKVPQIVPSKKYVNIQSPVAQYIRNTPVKTPVLDPVLRDCMNHMHIHEQLESPYHLYQKPKGGSAKSTKRKA